jgi:ZIP family zinc transporter
MPAIQWFAERTPVVQALLGGTATWALTALGALLVLTTRRVDPRLSNALLGFASGIMIAASFWSLLAPAIELSRASGVVSWGPPLTGFLAGSAFLWVVNRILPHLHPGQPIERAEGPSASWDRSVLLVLAITLHNIPEGLAVGVSFAAVAAGLEPSVTLGNAIALTLGIGLQNVPEGLAVAMPLRREGLSRARSFFWGQLSAAVEPIAAVIGAAAVLAVGAMLPYALSFAAGAMIYVVIEDLIPTSHADAYGEVATVGATLGFAVMMVLDVALG